MPIPNITLRVAARADREAGLSTWSALITMGPHRKTLEGTGHGSQQGAVLDGICTALRSLKRPCCVEIRTGNRFLREISDRLPSLSKVGWVHGRNPDRTPRILDNVDEWRSLHRLLQDNGHRLAWRYIHEVTADGSRCEPDEDDIAVTATAGEALDNLLASRGEPTSAPADSGEPPALLRVA